MKMYRSIILVFLIFSNSLFSQNTQCPFNKGFNLGGWFQKYSAVEIINSQTITQLENQIALGADHVRLPINLLDLCGSTPEFTLDPIFLLNLDRTVDWAEELGIHIILDNHPIQEVDTNNTNKLVAVWQQMASHFKNRSNFVLYEIWNEPYGVDDDQWGEMQGKAIDAIRAIDTIHTIIVSPGGMGSLYSLNNLPVYEDDNLIYTFHFYYPMLFTHQGADWVNPSMALIASVPYPYDSTRMPEMPAEYLGTWLGDAYENYTFDGNKEYNQLRIEIVKEFRTSRQVPVYCGEFGVLLTDNNEAEREQWTEDMADIFETAEIAWSMWGYGGIFGIFKKGSSGRFPVDLDPEMVEALGLTIPQLTDSISPDTTEITIYDELSHPRLTDVCWMGPSPYYYVGNAAQGEYCIRWTGASQYHNFGWEYTATANFTYLMENDYVLKFWIKSTSPNLSIEFRFNDTDLQDGIDHPWRMSKTIDNNIVEMDGNWHEVEFRLKDMEDSGSWHNDSWYGPEGAFDWSQIATLQFVAEHHDLGTTEVYIDNIRIEIGEINTAVEPEIYVTPNSLDLHEIYPNPFNTSTTFKFDLITTENVDLRIYNSSGKLVRILQSGNLSKGYHNITWDALDEKGNLSPSSIYVFVLKAGQQIRRGKIILRR